MNRTINTSPDSLRRLVFGWISKPWLLMLSALLAALAPTGKAEIIPPGCTGNGYYIALFVDKPLAHVGDQIWYSIAVGNQVFPSCRAIENKASITTPDGVVHQIQLNRTTLNPNESDVYQNVVSYVIREQDIKNGIVVGAANASAVINQNVVNESSTSFKDVNTRVVTPCISIEATCVGGVGEGAAITFSGLVRNCGDIGLTGVTVTNTFTGQLVFGPADLAAGAQAPFSGSFVPTVPCAGTAGLVAYGVDAVPVGPISVTASTSVSCANSTAPLIEVTRLCPEAITPAGGVLTYSGTVRNLGNVTLTNVVVVSDRPAANTVVYSVATLAPGAAANFTGSYTTPADACAVTDTLTASGRDRCSGQTVTDSDTGTCPLRTVGTIDLTINCPPTAPSAGGTITYSGSVSNPGDVSLINVVVVNDNAPGQPIFQVASLAPKATANFTATSAVPANACNVTTAFTASATDRCGTAGLSDKAAVTCPVNNNPAIVVTHECPTETLLPGATSAFAGTVRNSGNVTLKNVTVLSGTTPVYGPASLEPGQSATFTASVTAPADGCAVTTTLTANGTDNCSERVVTSTSAKTCPVATNPALVLTKACPTEPAPAGGTITYAGSVQNSGNVTLNEVQVTSGGTRVFGPVTLAPGASATFTATANVPLDACVITDTWAATGKDNCSGAIVTQSATTSCPVLTAPQVDLTVACPTAAPTPSGTVTYTGSVRNTGTVTLTNVVVINDATPGQPVFQVASLAPGASANFNATGTVPSGDCSVTASFRVTTAGLCGATGIADTASVTCPVTTNPAIVVTHECPVGGLTPGQAAAFPATVQNTGNVALKNVTVVSGTTTVYGPATLAPGQSATFTASVSAPVDSCSVNTTLTATGAGNCDDRVVTSTSTKTCPVTTSPALIVTAACPTEAAPAGGKITYAGSVQNTGNVTLNDVQVSSASGRVFGPINLAPGASATYTATANVPADACVVTATWTATGKDKCTGTAVTQSATTSCPVQSTPNVELTVACPSGSLTAGGSAKLSGNVINRGSVTLTNLVVFAASSETPAVTIPSLRPGASAPYSVTVSVPNNVCSLTTQVRVTASDLCSGTLATATASATCPVATTPAITVTLSCPTEPGTPGLPSTSAGRVSNTGNVTLTNVVVMNTVFSATKTVFGPASLAPGQSADFTSTYTVPQGILGCTYENRVNASGADNCTGRSVTAQNLANCPIDFLPGIEVIYHCPERPVAQGQLLHYSATVKNVGNVTLKNIRVIDSITGDKLVNSRSSLPAGAEYRFEAYFKVADDCCTVSSTLTATAVDECTEQSVMDTSTGTCPVLFKPRIAVTKECPSEPASPGDTMTFTGTVRNTGDITLDDVKLSQTVAGEQQTFFGPIVLAPGQVVNYKNTFVVPTDYCGDVVTATGTALCTTRTNVSATVTTRCKIQTTPWIMVTKECPVAPVAPGGVFTFKGTVYNVGDTTLTDVMVYNDQPARNTLVFGPVTLRAGASADFTGSYTLEANCCETVDVLTVRGLDQCTGKRVENSGAAACPVLWSPRIEVTKQCTGESFTGTVKNTGGITLTNVVVYLQNIESQQPVLGPIELAPGEVKTFRGTGPTASVVTARAIALCNQVQISAQATCDGPVDESVFGITDVSLVDGQLNLSWKSIPGRYYEVQYTSDISSGEWESVTDPVQATTPVTRVVEPKSNGTSRSYRVLMLE